MKNTHITSLIEPVPIEIRIEVYKEALSLIESSKFHRAEETYGLCILLPCILWDLDNMLNLTPNKKIWNLDDIPNIFPEVTKDYLKDISKSKNSLDDKTIRSKWLSKWIEQLTNQLQHGTK